MSDNVDPSMYPTSLYRNKLLFPQYLRSENIVTQNVIDMNVEGDWLLYSYIVELDYETFSDMPVGLGNLGEALWVDDDWSSLMPKIVDESRKHGWCVVQFYDVAEDAASPRWRVLSRGSFTDWIKETAKDGTILRMGAKFKWGDDIGNSGEEECLFADNDCFLFKFREGNGQNIFAYSDISDALLDIAFSARQVKGQMDFIGSKPAFKHYKYGQSADDESITKLDAKIKYVDVSAGIGAPIGVLENIESITDDGVYVVLPIFEKEVEIFAGVTRLPVSYYMGQRTSGGLGEKGETVDLLKIDRKKAALFARYAPQIKTFFYDMYDITIAAELELQQDETLDDVEEDDNGQEGKGTARTGQQEED